jgi:hypothetical protein
MKLTRDFLSLILVFFPGIISFLSLPLQRAIAQDAKVALQRGYRTGYSDGYMSGYRDSIDNVAKDYSRHNEYTDASRAYNQDYGAIGRL